MYGAALRDSLPRFFSPIFLLKSPQLETAGGNFGSDGSVVERWGAFIGFPSTDVLDDARENVTSEAANSSKSSVQQASNK